MESIFPRLCVTLGIKWICPTFGEGNFAIYESVQYLQGIRICVEGYDVRHGSKTSSSRLRKGMKC